MSTAKKLPVSAIILAHIYDNRLKNAIKSISFCQEIIVITNNQKIDWRNLQENLEVRLINYPHKIENFARVRNWAIQQVQFDWVLFIDSDEEIANPKQAVELIDQATKTSTPAFNFYRSDIFYGFELRHGETAKQKQPKLINKTRVKFIRPIHEIIKCKPGQKPANLPIKLLHYSHLSISNFLKDIRSYAEREAHYRFKENKLHKISIVLQLIIFPIFKFICNYFLKWGFLDRMPGLIYASLMSFHSILVRIYGWQLINHHEY